MTRGAMPAPASQARGFLVLESGLACARGQCSRGPPPHSLKPPPERRGPARLPLLQTESLAPLSACFRRRQLKNWARRSLQQLSPRAGSLALGAP